MLKYRKMSAALQEASSYTVAVLEHPPDKL